MTSTFEQELLDPRLRSGSPANAGDLRVPVTQDLSAATTSTSATPAAADPAPSGTEEPSLSDAGSEADESSDDGAPAGPSQLPTCCLCNNTFTRRSSIRLRHWPRCERERGNPQGLQWDAHPSCRVGAYNYKTTSNVATANAAPAAPSAPSVAAPPIAATTTTTTTAAVAAAAAAPAPRSAAAPPLAAAATTTVTITANAPPTAAPTAATAGPSAPPTASAAGPSASRKRKTTAAVAGPRPKKKTKTGAALVEEEIDDIDEDIVETAAYGPPKWTSYHYLGRANLEKWRDDLS
ncbi:hypothetical protein MMC18_006762 [Xylographa bjoerkii]|nr:hypothetical protein [Xylographa bjoerkii]